MKNWRTTLLGVLGAGLILATSKGLIDQELAAFIGATVMAIFGAASSDSKVQGIVSPKPPRQN